MADITPLRGEGRTVGRITGLWGELLSEFFGTFVLIAFGDGVVAMAVAALPGSGRTAGPTDDLPGGGRLAADHLGLGDGRRLRRLDGRRRERRPPQPGGDAGVRGPAQVRLGEGAALLGRPGDSARSSAPRWSSCVYHNAINAFNTAAGTPKSGGSALATYSIFATFPAGYFHGGIRRAADRPDRRHRVPADLRRRGDRHAGTPPCESNLAPLVIGLGVAAIGMSYGAERRLRDQPGPRLRPPAVRLLRRLGQGRPARHVQRGRRSVQRLLLDTDRRAAHRRHRRHPALRPVHRRRAARPAQADRGRRGPDPGEPRWPRRPARADGSLETRLPDESETGDRRCGPRLSAGPRDPKTTRAEPRGGQSCRISSAPSTRAPPAPGS